MRHILFAFSLILFASQAFGQQVVIRNPEIQQLVQQVNADSLKKYTEKLASFHSRHTLNTDAKNGMIAAQNYVKAKFTEFSTKSKGRMTANIEEFVVPGDGRRIVADAKVGNVIARLPGTNPNDPRIIVVSGHLDSRNKDVMDAAGAAPGANDDAETNISNNTVMRVFSETIPLAEDERGGALRRSINSDNDSPSRQLARYIKELGERYVDQMEVKLIYRNDRFLRGGDQTPFMKNGFTAVRMSEMNENFLHQHENVRVENGIQCTNTKTYA